jgi:hypothetical protein
MVRHRAQQNHYPSFPPSEKINDLYWPRELSRSFKGRILQQEQAHLGGLMDIVSKEVRSRMMASIRKPEAEMTWLLEAVPDCNLQHISWPTFSFRALRLTAMLRPCKPAHPWSQLHYR